MAIAVSDQASFLFAHLKYSLQKNVGCLISSIRYRNPNVTTPNAALTGAEGVRVEGTVMQQEN